MAEAHPDPDRVFAALADARRRELLELLALGPDASAGGLAAMLPVSRQAVAQHLAVLEEGRLVRRRTPPPAHRPRGCPAGPRAPPRRPRDRKGAVGNVTGAVRLGFRGRGTSPRAVPRARDPPRPPARAPLPPPRHRGQPPRPGAG